MRAKKKEHVPVAQPYQIKPIEFEWSFFSNVVSGFLRTQTNARVFYNYNLEQRQINHMLSILLA